MNTKPINRRSFLKRAAGITALGAAGIAGSAYWFKETGRISKSLGKKVIVIGIDGMDPRLCSSMMEQGLLPNLKKIGAEGGFARLGTSVPPQSPVAWANFINGAGPGSHGIFDFIHRYPHDPAKPFYSAAETLPAEGSWELGDHRVQFPFWPFNHRPATTILRRQGVPFWDYLDAAKVPSTFYDLPSNYPPSPSPYGYHRCLCGMGTPDMLGSYGTYQYFSEDSPERVLEEGGGQRIRLRFAGDTATASLVGPENTFLKSPRPTTIDFTVHRDRRSNAAVIEIQGRKIVLQAGTWSRWTKLDFTLSMPTFSPNQHASGLCRFYLQEVSPNFRLYLSPINVDPSCPAVQISEPTNFCQKVSQELGLFATLGFQEDHKARSNGIFSDEEFLRQATSVLEERLTLLEYALNNYDDGMLFFYFSSTDLQSHMFWWDTDEKHPVRSRAEAQKCFGYIAALYRRLDAVIGDIHRRYGSKATIIVMSDHGFANFRRQFNLNSWLRKEGYLGPQECSSILQDADWSQTRAYGLGINGLYLNLKGREAEGCVEPGEDREQLTRQLIDSLEAIRDIDGRQVISRVYRTDRIYSGSATKLAPDLIIGYARGYRASWDTCLGNLSEEILSDNRSAWSADHCVDAQDIPGVIFCNRPFREKDASLIDLAPTILSEYGLPTPSTMTGRTLFET